MGESTRYISLWRNKWLTANAKTIGDMIDALRCAAYDLEKMKNDGVILSQDGGTGDDYAQLITTDKVVAARYGFESEDDLYGFESGIDPNEDCDAGDCVPDDCDCESECESGCDEASN